MVVGGTTLNMENRSQTWDWPFMEVFDVLGHRFHRDGEGGQGIEKTLRKGVGNWWRDGYICRSRSVPTKTKCRRVSVMFAAPPSINWLTKVRLWKSKILRLTLRPKTTVGKVGSNARRELHKHCAKCKEKNAADDGQKNVQNSVKTMKWTTCERDVLGFFDATERTSVPIHGMTLTTCCAPSTHATVPLHVV